MYVERLTEEEINLIDKTYVDGEDFDFPVIKNIQIKALGGNYCNLSCHMCHASESSGLALENRKLGIPDNHPLDRPAKYSFPWNQEGLEEYLRKTQRLNLVGGETLAIKENYDLLKKCILMGVAKNIEVQIGSYSLHMHKAFQNNQLIEIKGEMENSKWCYEHALALPLFNDLTSELQELIIEELVNSIKECAA